MPEKRSSGGASSGLPAAASRTAGLPPRPSVTRNRRPSPLTARMSTSSEVQTVLPVSRSSRRRLPAPRTNSRRPSGAKRTGEMVLSALMSSFISLPSAPKTRTRHRPPSSCSATASRSPSGARTQSEKAPRPTLAARTVVLPVRQSPVKTALPRTTAKRRPSAETAANSGTASAATGLPSASHVLTDPPPTETSRRPSALQARLVALTWRRRAEPRRTSAPSGRRSPSASKKARRGGGSRSASAGAAGSRARVRASMVILQETARPILPRPEPVERFLRRLGDAPRRRRRPAASAPPAPRPTRSAPEPPPPAASAAFRRPRLSPGRTRRECPRSAAGRRRAGSSPARPAAPRPPTRPGRAAP